MARRGRWTRTLRIALGLVAAGVIGAGALGWRISVRFVAPPTQQWQTTVAPPVLLRLRPVWLPDVDSLLAGSPAPPPSPRRFSGLHMTFPQEWPGGVYEIGSSTQPPSPASPVRFVCEACPAVHQMLNLSPNAPSDREKFWVDVATFGVIRMAGGGRVTLLEWDPWP